VTEPTPKRKKLPFFILGAILIAAIFGVPMLIDNIKVSKKEDYMVIGAFALVGVAMWVYWFYIRKPRS
jgi:hypothetical protein